MTPEILALIAAAVGSVLPKLASKIGWKVPDIFHPDPPKPADGVAPASGSPLPACYAWLTQANDGLIAPTDAELRLLKAMKKRLDALVPAEKVGG